MKYNCVSYAMKLEEESNQDNLENLDWTLAPAEAVEAFAEKHGLLIRELEDEHSILASKEWMIVFWGFIYIYDPDDYSEDFRSSFPDYHFARKCEDGIWRERMAWEKPIVPIDLYEKIKLFGAYGYKPKFFAIKKAED